MTNPLLEQEGNSAGDADTLIPARIPRHSTLARGISVTRLPSQTRAVAEALLSRGAELIQGLCSVAEEKRYEFSSLGTIARLIPAPSTSSIADLARQIQWGYDTLNAHIIILCAFGILRKSKNGKHTELWIPLEAGYAPDPDQIIHELRTILDPERGYRNTVRHLVASAMANFIRLYPAAGGMEEIKGLLCSTFSEHITQAAASLENFLATSALDEIRIGSLHIRKGDPAPSSPGRPGTQSPELKDSARTGQPKTRQNLPGNADSEIQQAGDESTESRQYGDSGDGGEPGISQNLPRGRDSVRYQRSSRLESSKATRFHQRTPARKTSESPDPSSMERDSENEALLPVPDSGNKYINIYSILSGISGTGGAESSNRRDSDKLAQELALLFERTRAPRAIHSYSTLLKLGEDIATAALAATLRSKDAEERMGPLKKPGGFFAARCKEYAEHGIPGEILEALDRYRKLPPKEIEDRIRALEQPLRTRTTPPFDTEGPIRGNPLTTREQAEALRKRIACDDSTVTVLPARAVSRPSGNEYVVDIQIDGHPYALASLEDWESHYRAVQELKTRLTAMGYRASP